MSATAPAVGPVSRPTYGVAGSVSYAVTVTYPGEAPMRVVFVGSAYGEPGPVSMITASIPGGVFVTDPGRFGARFDAEWVRRFYA